MPRSGKTTAVEVMEGYFKRGGARVRVVYEGARISPLDKSDRFNYHSWSFHNTVNRILEARIDHYDFILVDRGVLDHLAFLDAIVNECTNRTGKDLDSVREYYSQFLGLQDKEIYFTVSPKEAIRREKKHKPFLGRVFNPDFLNKLNRAYEWIFRELGSSRNIIRISGNGDLEKNLEKIARISEGMLDELKGGKDEPGNRQRVQNSFF